MSGTVLTITDATFSEEVLQASQPVLVYFWAEWCGPCRLMPPILDAVAPQFGDRLKIVKLEIDPNPQSVAAYQVEGVPALRVIRDGQMIASLEGVVNRQKLEEFINTTLSAAA